MGVCRIDWESVLQGPALGRLVKRFGERALNRVGFHGLCVRVRSSGLLPFDSVLALATLVTSIGGLVRPTLTSLITQATPREEQGVVLGLTQSLNSVALIIAPPLGGLLDRAWMADGLGTHRVGGRFHRPDAGLRVPDELRENRPTVNATAP